VALGQLLARSRSSSRRGLVAVALTEGVAGDPSIGGTLIGGADALDSSTTPSAQGTRGCERSNRYREALRRTVG
jgi:hypothetical protein